MNIPYLKDNEFAVGKAKYATGHVLKNDGSLFLTGDQLEDVYEIFENFEEAKKFAVEKIYKDSGIECWIVNNKGDLVVTYDVNGERAFSK